MENQGSDWYRHLANELSWWREREECGWKEAHYALTGCWPNVPSVLFLDLGSGSMNIGTIKIKLYIYAFCVFLYVCSTSLQSIKNVKC